MPPIDGGLAERRLEGRCLGGAVRASSRWPAAVHSMAATVLAPSSCGGGSAAAQSKPAAPPASGSRPFRPVSTSELAAREVLRRQPGLQTLVGCVAPDWNRRPANSAPESSYTLYHPELNMLLAISIE